MSMRNFMEEKILVINNIMTTFSTIRDIFYSGTQMFRGNQDSISEIAFLVDENYLLISTIIIASKNKYQGLLNNPDKLNQLYEAAGGSSTHVALKVLTKEYLKKSRSCESVFEHPFCGYYPDVLSADKTIVAECGHTDNSEKILTYFKQGNIKECIQIPYPSDEDNNVKGYSFTAHNNLKDFLIFLEQEKHKELKKLIMKNKKKY